MVRRRNAVVLGLGRKWLGRLRLLSAGQAVKLWPAVADKNESEIIAIRGPPDELMPEDEPPDDRWDGWDEPQELDWVA